MRIPNDLTRDPCSVYIIINYKAYNVILEQEGYLVNMNNLFLLNFLKVVKMHDINLLIESNCLLPTDKMNTGFLLMIMEFSMR